MNFGGGYNGKAAPGGSGQHTKAEAGRGAAPGRRNTTVHEPYHKKNAQPDQYPSGHGGGDPGAAAGRRPPGGAAHLHGALGFHGTHLPCGFADLRKSGG